MFNKKKKVHVVDGQKDWRRETVDELASHPMIDVTSSDTLDPNADVNVWGMAGFRGNVSGKIKEAIGAGTKVVVASSAIKTDEMREAFRAGATDVVDKTFTRKDQVGQEHNSIYHIVLGILGLGTLGFLFVVFVLSNLV